MGTSVFSFCPTLKIARTKFNTERAIFVPPNGSRTASWVGPDTCLWEVPDFIDVLPRLAAVEEYSSNEVLRRLFHGRMRIPNVRLSDYIKQLIRTKDRGQGPLGSVPRIYYHLSKIVSEENSESVL